MPDFVHLHNHTEFSLLDGAAKISDMTQKACDCGMSHIAITDHGNMYGIPKFVLAARRNNLKPIVGCEFYVTAKDATSRIKGDKRYHQIMWAKDKEGYQNLVKLCSYGYTDGYYYKPRIDKNILKQHAKGLIASTCCLASQVNQTFLNEGEEAGEKVLKEYMDIFGKENYYIEIQRHTLGDMDKCNEWLIRMSKKHDLTVIATNDVHYVNEEDSEAHDLLLALQTQSDYNDPNRFRFTDDKGRLNPRFYFKTQNEMLELFQDIPQALDNTVQLAERCTFELNLAGDMILPQYKVPEQYKDMDDFLAAMVWERAPKRYPEITTEIRERIEHELKIMKRMGYAGYFLIVQSFTTEARNRGVYVGPGRGSAAGSVVAYILGIIDIDPLQYDLLFERFLNPERVSPPDIDIDFDDEGRQEVIDYVGNEYGRKSVSQVITYGTMGAKTAIRDVGRTLNIPLAEVNRIAKMIPDKPGITFRKALDGDQNPDFAEELGQLFQSKDPLINKMMRFAKTLEGTARHTGVHACAVIIAPGDVTNYAPVAVAKDESLVTQYDGPMAEMCGLLKMDFLGLKTLSIPKTAIRLVKENHGVEIDPDNIDITDKATYDLYQRGDTVATFQFESDGMRKYLRKLKPTNIEDLIAMNALYRPGPMDNIPSFVDRKHGREKIVYPHDMLEPILKNTYGIMVYQEQIMQVARTMGGYTMGGADLLRRAMGKKKMDIMAKEKAHFIDGASKNGVEKKTADEVFSLMEKFASYGFNKSHAAAYSLLAFKTAYLKAHYPSEYMAAVL
ncbi:MAG: DNA polymerase III subunit alpha, partial [Bacteroidetes bacterium]|nr:DNA polymerase III subunit alpha [Bacteroidota bacterium]